jgi:hypothetical protein
MENKDFNLGGAETSRMVKNALGQKFTFIFLTTQK